MILDAPPHVLRKRAKSIPDLLHLIDAAAENFGLDIGQSARSSEATSHGYEDVVDPGETSRSQRPPNDAALTRSSATARRPPLSRHTSIRESAEAVGVPTGTRRRSHADLPSPHPSTPSSSPDEAGTPFHTAAHTANPSPEHSPVSEIASSLPSAWPANPQPPTALPSEVFRSRNFSPSPPQTPERPVFTPPTGLRDPRPMSPRGQLSHERPMSPREQLSRERLRSPPPRSAFSPPPTGRHPLLSPPPSSVYDLPTPHRNAIIRPSDILERQRMQRREMDREAATVERQQRVERRGRVGRAPVT